VIGKSDLAVIGGGVIGMSIAYYCARAGIGVTVVERGGLGQATTAQTARVVRGYFPGRPKDTALAVRSLTDYHELAVDLDTDLGLSQTGFLVVLDKEDQVERLTAELEVQRKAGAEVDVVTTGMACQLNPWLDPAEIIRAIWSPQAYSCDPQAIVEMYATGAAQHGAKILTNTTVLALDASTGTVETTAGAFEAKSMVCAAGPWSGEVAAMAGISLPVSPQASELMVTESVDFPMTPPFTLHPSSRLRTRRLDDVFLVGLEGVAKAGSHRRAWHEAAQAEVSRRYLNLNDLPLRTAWQGELDVAESRTAFIGRIPDQERFLYASGFTGRGLCQAPMAGQIIRDLYLGRPPQVDLSPYSLNR
jgi:sarcosine oxidase subunit beta